MRVMFTAAGVPRHPPRQRSTGGRTNALARPSPPRSTIASWSTVMEVSLDQHHGTDGGTNLVDHHTLLSKRSRAPLTGATT